MGSHLNRSGRLDTVSDGTNIATYSYLANSPLVEQIDFTHDSTTVMTTTKGYDLLNRLTNITSVPSVSSAVSFDYVYNTANQRTSVTNADGSYWVYEYDDLGQVILGKKRWSDGTLVAGQQFEYGFDDIGNREFSKAGGDQNGANLRTTPYQPNLLNQYEMRLVPPQVSVIGEADADATVTVNLASTVRKGEYWWGEAVATNSGGPVWLAITNIAVLEDGANPNIVATNVGHTRVAQALEEFTYDDDGNLISDSLWLNTWNGENRRTLVESSAAVPAAGRAREQWTFLPDGRWIERVVSTNNGSAYYPASTNRYVWDGNVLLAVLDNTNGLELAFMRGLDLSGTMQGAGGVGGLLLVKSAEAGTQNFAAYDGNGNVMALVDASTGEESARYEYGPFGELLRTTGPMAEANPIRFSTQYADDVTGDLKYLYRDYRADFGRWLNRDSIEEWGGINLSVFVQNRPIAEIDSYGLLVFDQPSRFIGVQRCEIVILFGHGSLKVGNTWTWRFTKTSQGRPLCNAGTAVMCSPVSNGRGIPADQDLWPVARTGQKEDILGRWGGGTPHPVEWGKLREGLYDLDAILTEAYREAVKRARAYCRDRVCCCKRVDVRFLQTRPRNYEVMPGVDPGDLPYKGPVRVRNVEVDCKTGRTRTAGEGTGREGASR